VKGIMTGLIVGAIAGAIDVLPMIVQKLSWDANLSAFCMWVVVGFLNATSTMRISAPLKGIVIAFAVLSPSAILIGWKEPFSLIPVGIMTLLLGAAVGWAIDKFTYT